MDGGSTVSPGLFFQVSCPWLMAYILKVTLQSWNFNYHGQVPGRDPEARGKGRKGRAQLVVAPFYETFLDIPTAYVVLVTAKFHGHA